MSAYAPSLPRTAELRGLDRALVQAGAALTALGRHRAEARARMLAARSAEAAVARDRHLDQRLERHLDNAAQSHPLLLR